MSKSVGNVLDPFELVDQYGVDYLRYFLASEIHFGNDGDFTHESFQNRINTDLANDLGNLAQRVCTMIYKQCDGKIPDVKDSPLIEEDIAVLNSITDALSVSRQFVSQQSIKNYCETVINLAKLGNRYIDTQAPWHLLKTDKERMCTVLYVLAELLRCSAVMLMPVIPDSAGRLLDQLGVPIDLRNFASIENKSRIIPGSEILQPKPLFPKLEKEDNSDSARRKSSKNEGSKDKIDQVLSFPAYDSLEPSEIAEKVTEVGNKIRILKAQQVDKSELAPIIAELKYLKNRYRTFHKLILLCLILYFSFIVNRLESSSTNKS